MCNIKNIVIKYSILFDIDYFILLRYFNDLINKLKCCNDICEIHCNFNRKIFTLIPKKKINLIHAKLNTCEKNVILNLVCEN